MTLDQIKAAVEAGKTVHWTNTSYQVIKDSINQWLIAYNRGGSRENYIGLTWQDGVTLNGKEEEFYIAGSPRWVVMTSSAKMPSRVQAEYRNIALVKRTEEYANANLMPKMISTHARGVEIVRHLGHFHVGRTPRGAFQKAFYAAEEQAAALNAAKE